MRLAKTQFVLFPTEGRKSNVPGIFRVQAFFGDLILSFQRASKETQAEVFLREMFDTLPHEIALLDDHGVVTDVNARWAQDGASLCARVRSLTRGDHALEILRAAGAQGDHVAFRFAEGVAAILDGGADFHLDYALEEQGRERWFSLDLRRLSSLRPAILISRIDVTGATRLQPVLDTAPTERAELKNAEDALRESEAQFRAIFELTGVGMAQADTKTRRFIRVNDTFARMLGFSKEELIGAPLTDFTHPDDRKAHLERFESMSRGETKFYQSEKRYLCKDGSVVWAHVIATKADAVDGSSTHTVAVIQDISDRKRIETELRDSGARLEQALEAANAGVWEFSPQAGVFSASPRARALLGISVDAPIGREDVLGALYTEDRDRFSKALANALNMGTPLKIEMRVRDETGLYKWVQLVGESCGEGEDVRLVGLAQDIDEAKRNEIALRESEIRLKLALDSGNNIGIYEWRVPTNEFIWDDRLGVQSGLAPDEIKNFTMFIDGIHPVDRCRVQEEIVRAVQAGDSLRSEFRISDRSNGAERWIAFTGTTFFENGRAVRMVGTAQDITSRKRVEIEHQKFVSLAEQSLELIGIFSLDLQPLYLNAAGLRQLGFASAEAAMHARLEDAFFPEDRAFVFEELFPKVLRAGHANVELRVRRFDTGEALWMLYNVFLLRDPPGAPVGFATVSRDITQKKRAEEALKEADQRKDEFLATFAHELRNPLAPIRNATYVLRHGSGATMLPKVSADLLSMIDRQSAHLVRLVDDLLEVSRITRGKIELRKQRVDLNAILRQAIETAQPTIAAGGHRLDLRLPPQRMALVADPVRLAQVFTNLLNNAAKYTENGGVISLVAEQTADQAVVTVRDSGVGIPGEMLPRVFDLFTQIDRTLGRAQGGLGIGLALVKRLVELHGGEVEAHSDGLGRGSAFIVRLRLVAEDGATAPMSSNVSNDLPVSRRILVIDDDHDVADSLVMFLETFGADVRVAYSGEGGVAALREFHPELVFLDLGMPKIDGYETARRIRALPEGRDVKLVALTGWGQGQIRERAHEAGFDCQLTKPAGIDALQALLNAM